jgi:alpha-glucosidase
VASVAVRAQVPAGTMPANRFAAASDWWRRAVLYEIYPRSFADSNNDGIGDLPGITAHLDHLRDLGIDAIWIAPCFPSQHVDFGYDVTNYRDIDESLGTLRDFDRLVAEAGQRGIKVVLDLVLNHTSSAHPWFVDSARSVQSRYHDYYVWRRGKTRGVPPNNWTSLFGGSSWIYRPAVDAWYYHFFDVDQPDLNWRNPKVEAEMFDVARFWYRRGVYGFRLDAVDTLFEDSALTDNPELKGQDAYGMRRQEHIYDHRMAEVHAELRRLRTVTDEFPGRVLIGETWTSTPAEIAAYYGPHGDELQMPMFLNLVQVPTLDARAFRTRIDAVEHNTADGWPVFVLGNHDVRRVVSRYAPNEASRPSVAKLLAALQLTLRGTPILYYGEELGMPNHDPTRVEEVKDVIGKRGWPKEKGRDGERTPMPWGAGVNGGFSRDARPWLPVGPSYPTINVASEARDPDSVLAWYRRLIALRRTDAALYDGAQEMVGGDDPHVLAYLRRRGARSLLVVLNLSAEARTVHFDPANLGGRRGRPLATTGRPTDVSVDQVELDPYGVRVLEVH